MSATFKRIPVLATAELVRLRPIDLIIICGLSFLFAALEGVGMGLMWPVLRYVDTGPAGLVAAMPFPLSTLLAYLSKVDLLNLGVLLAVLMAVLLLRETAKYQRTVYLARRGQDFFVALLTEISDALLHAKLDFHHHRNRGVLQSRLYNDTRYAAQIVQILADYLVSVLLVTAYTLVMCALSWQLTLLLLPVFAIVQLSGLALSRGAAAAGIAASKGYADLGRSTNKHLQNVAFVKSRYAEQASLKRIVVMAHTLADILVSQERLKAFAAGMSQPILFLGTLVGIYIAVETMAIRFSELAVFVFVLTRLIALYSTVVSLGVQHKISVQSLQVLEALKRETVWNKEIDKGVTPFCGLRQAIRLDNVSFTYGLSHKPALSNVSLTIHRGAFVAIVGQSGAGKTTLVSMIIGFSVPSKGTVYFDETPLSSIKASSLRQRMAIVEQDPVMFDEWIRTNLTFGILPSPSDQRLISILKSVHAWEFVAAMPEELNTVVGERGARISGGQRQRLALARALCAEPDVLNLSRQANERVGPGNRCRYPWRPARITRAHDDCRDRPPPIDDP